MPFQLKVTSIQPIGTSGRLIQFERPVDWSHQAGQYLTLLLTLGGQEIRRSYSLCSLPEEAPAIAVARVTNGLVSRWLIDQLKVGDLLESLPPTGRFVLPASLPPMLVFVAAGSGITAVLPLIKQALAESKVKVRLIYACKNRETAWFASELLHMQHNQANQFEIDWFESQPANGAPQRLGNMRLEMLVNCWPAWQHALYYVCGPAAFMRMVKLTLGFMGIAAASIHQENFASEGQRFFSGKKVSDAAVNCEVSYYKGNNKQVWHVAKGETVLESAQKAGISLLYSCENGFCGSCMLRKKTGNVVHRINEVLTDAELDAGCILSCTAYPTSTSLTLEAL
jgi:ring-1,2-phenylacetyl-CoA epoxidase subunit PaaE